MSRLLDHLLAEANKAEKAASKAQEDAAVAIAYARPEQDNQRLVDTAIAAITKRPDDPAPILTAAFVAALAALPAEARSRTMSQLQSAISANRKLKDRTGWAILKKRINEAAKKIDTAHSGASNADGITAGTIVDAKDPLALAKAFESHYEHDGHCTIRRWKGRWFRWSVSAYDELDDEILDGQVYAFLATLCVASDNGPLPLKPHKQLVEYVMHALAPLVQVPGSSPTRWLDSETRARPPIDRCVLCTNGTLDIDAWIAGTEDAFIAPTPALFVLRTLGMPFDPMAKAPRFEQFITDIFDADPDRINAMQILFGYWLIASTSLQIIVIFSGLPQTGKGTLMAIIQGILGIACTNPSFEQLGGPFGLERSRRGEPSDLVGRPRHGRKRQERGREAAQDLRRRCGRRAAQAQAGAQWPAPTRALHPGDE